MKCEKVRDLLITDFEDRETDAVVEKDIRDHLKGCEACRVFGEKIREMSSEVMRGTLRQQPPEALWMRIKSAVEEEQNRSGLIERLAGACQEFMRNLRWLFLTRRPVVIIPSALALLLAVVILPRAFQDRPGNYELGVYLIESVSMEVSEADELYWDTPVEEFLL